MVNLLSEGLFFSEMLEELETKRFPCLEQVFSRAQTFSMEQWVYQVSMKKVVKMNHVAQYTDTF